MYKIISIIKKRNKETFPSLKANTVVIKSIIMSKDFNKSYNGTIKRVNLKVGLWTLTMKLNSWELGIFGYEERRKSSLKPYIPEIEGFLERNLNLELWSFEFWETLLVVLGIYEIGMISFRMILSIFRMNGGL